jgi:hypothetical protein
MQTAPPKSDYAPALTEKSRLAQENLGRLRGLLAERVGGGFASSPDVPASRLGPRIVYSRHAGYRVEGETSGLAAMPAETRRLRTLLAPSFFVALHARFANPRPLQWIK